LTIASKPSDTVPAPATPEEIEDFDFDDAEEKVVKEKKPDGAKQARKRTTKPAKGASGGQPSPQKKRKSTMDGAAEAQPSEKKTKKDDNPPNDPAKKAPSRSRAKKPSKTTTPLSDMWLRKLDELPEKAGDAIGLAVGASSSRVITKALRELVNDLKGDKPVQPDE
jgi:hypothetical protein